ncbi:MAG: DUF4321 domain-containing protein [Clostridia bacterium]|nr:DUF4321 domain-containing protein [Clostridia bacterium]
MMKFIKYTAFPVLCGIVLGMLVAALTKDVSYLSWLSFGLNIGMTSPLVLDLSIIGITLGITVNINVAVIVFIIISLLVSKRLYRR